MVRFKYEYEDTGLLIFIAKICDLVRVCLEAQEQGSFQCRADMSEHYMSRKKKPNTVIGTVTRAKSCQY
jgi:hypothetical protein